jgi:hypothetical protein
MTPPTAPLSLRADHDRAVGHLSDGGWDIIDAEFDFTRQVQVAADNAKNGSARLAGVEPPRYEDNATKITRRPSINSRRDWQKR